MSTWRWGVLLDERTADMLDEAQALCGVRITCTQGSYSGGVSQSAGTHDGGGAVDLAGSGLNQNETQAILLALRQVGFAAWHRNPSQGDWPYHFHAIAGGCVDLSSGARDQWADYLNGRNGLANNAPDDGPRDFDHVGIVWEEYQQRQGQQQPEEPEDEDVKPWIAQDPQGIALVWIDPSRGEIVWENVGHGDSVPGWAAAGVPGPIMVSDIGVLGVQVGRGVS